MTRLGETGKLLVHRLKSICFVKGLLYSNSVFLQNNIFYCNDHEELIFSVYFVLRCSKMELERNQVSKLLPNSETLI